MTADPSGRFVGFTVTFCSHNAGCGSSGSVIDRQTGVESGGCVEGDDNSVGGISRDGRLVLCNANTVPNPLSVVLINQRTGEQKLVAVAVDGGDPDDLASGEALSPSGRFVLFGSYATNLVRGDTNGKTDAFVRDMRLGTTERVSVGPHGRQANGDSAGTAISGNGRFAVFDSAASNLVAGDTNGKTDVFLRDRRSGTTERISIPTGGGQANGDSGGVPFDGLPASGYVSDAGRIVVFDSVATNLVRGDHNGKRDVFVRDRQARTTVRISLGWNGHEADGDSHVTGLSPDGRFVVFESDASNLVPGDGNRVRDVFVYDRQSSTTERISVSSKGVGGDQPSGDGAVSADGKTIAFSSSADNLVQHDADNTIDIFVRLR